jgi:hypothetical protein
LSKLSITVAISTKASHAHAADVDKQSDYICKQHLSKHRAVLYQCATYSPDVSYSTAHLGMIGFVWSMHDEAGSSTCGTFT